MKVFTALLSCIMMIFSSLFSFTELKDNDKYITKDGVKVDISEPFGGGADPWYCKFGEKYYYCYSVGNGVAVKCSDDIMSLYEAEGKVVYRAPSGTMYSTDYWAPELHYIDGKYYIYVAADDGKNENHRMYVLSCDEPCGEYTFVGKISDPTDKWAIDGTVVTINDDLWFVWSGWEGDEDIDQYLYIAHMSSPTQIDSERTVLSRPTHRWEKNGKAINEGPVALYLNGKTFVVFSASGSWTDDYCLGMLEYNGGDPSSPASWTKCSAPVFKKTAGAYGPGHCSFITEENGYNYIVYHANEKSGTGWNGRSVRMQQFKTVNSYPVFGKPIVK